MNISSNKIAWLYCLRVVLGSIPAGTFQGGTLLPHNTEGFAVSFATKRDGEMPQNAQSFLRPGFMFLLVVCWLFEWAFVVFAGLPVEDEGVVM